MWGGRRNEGVSWEKVAKEEVRVREKCIERRKRVGREKGESQERVGKEEEGSP